MPDMKDVTHVTINALDAQGRPVGKPFQVKYKAPFHFVQHRSVLHQNGEMVPADESTVLIHGVAYPVKGYVPPKVSGFYLMDVMPPEDVAEPQRFYLTQIEVEEYEFPQDLPAEEVAFVIFGISVPESAAPHPCGCGKGTDTNGDGDCPACAGAHALH